MPAGKDSLQAWTSGSDFCCNLWLVVMEGVAKESHLSRLDTRPVVSSCHPCHPTLVAGTYGLLVARMCQSTKTKGHLLLLVSPLTVHGRWARQQVNNSWSISSPPNHHPSTHSPVCGIDLRHVNLENKFLWSTMVPNHACHRNKQEKGDQQYNTMDSRKVCDDAKAQGDLLGIRV